MKNVWLKKVEQAGGAMVLLPRVRMHTTCVSLKDSLIAAESTGSVLRTNRKYCQELESTQLKFCVIESMGQ